MSHMLLMRHKYIDMEYNKLEDHIANVLHQDQAEIDIEAFIQDLHRTVVQNLPWYTISSLDVDIRSVGHWTDRRRHLPYIA